MNAIAEAKRILASPPAHCILSTPEWRELVSGMLAEIERLEAELYQEKRMGDFL